MLARLTRGYRATALVIPYALAMTDTDPYAAQDEPRVVAERTSQLDGFTARLRELGATDDEVELVVATWDDLEEDTDDPEAWTEAKRTELVNRGDNELREMILASRAEYDHDTTTEAEAAAREQEAATRVAQLEAEEKVHGTVAEVLEWVGDDTVRAAAVLAIESRPEAGNRKTLIGALREKLDAPPA